MLIFKMSSRSKVSTEEGTRSRLQEVLAAGLAADVGARGGDHVKTRIEKTKENFVKETLKSSVILERVAMGKEFQESWLNGLMDAVLHPAKDNEYTPARVLEYAKKQIQNDEEMEGAYEIFYEKMVLSIADLTSAVTCITGTADNQMSVSLTALEIAKALTAVVDVGGTTLPRAMSEATVKMFERDQVYVTLGAATKAMSLLSAMFPSAATRRAFVLHLPAGLGETIISMERPRPPPPPPPRPLTRPLTRPPPPSSGDTGMYMSTTVTGPKLTAIRSMLEAMPARPVTHDVAHAAIQDNLHEFISARALRNDGSNHVALAKDIAVSFWACVAFCQFQPLQLVGQKIGNEVPFVCLSFMRVLDEMARNAIGDFREGGDTLKYIKEARKEMGFTGKDKGSMVDLMDKYVSQSKYMRKGAKLAMRVVQDSGNDPRQMPLWVKKGATEDDFELPGDALDQAARFTKPAKKSQDAVKNVKFVLDVLWEPFVDVF